jgi:hypothetical protein
MQVPSPFPASVIRAPSPTADCTCVHWEHCDHACHGRHCDPTENACDVAYLPDEGGRPAGAVLTAPGRGRPALPGELTGRHADEAVLAETCRRRQPAGARRSAGRVAATMGRHDRACPQPRHLMDPHQWRPAADEGRWPASPAGSTAVAPRAVVFWTPRPPWITRSHRRGRRADAHAAVRCRNEFVVTGGHVARRLPGTANARLATARSSSRPAR